MEPTEDHTGSDLWLTGRSAFFHDTKRGLISTIYQITRFFVVTYFKIRIVQFRGTYGFVSYDDRETLKNSKDKNAATSC